MKPTLRQRVECARWLSACLKLGWKKSSLDDLDAIWWKYHRRAAPVTPPEGGEQAKKEIVVRSHDKLDKDIKALRALDRAVKAMSPRMVKVKASLDWAYGKYVGRRGTEK